MRTSGRPTGSLILLGVLAFVGGLATVALAVVLLVVSSVAKVVVWQLQQAQGRQNG